MVVTCAYRRLTRRAVRRPVRRATRRPSEHDVLLSAVVDAVDRPAVHHERADKLIFRLYECSAAAGDQLYWDDHLLRRALRSVSSAKMISTAMQPIAAGSCRIRSLAGREVGKKTDAPEIGAAAAGTGHRSAGGGIEDWCAQIMDLRFSAAWAWAGNTPFKWWNTQPDGRALAGAHRRHETRCARTTPTSSTFQSSQ